MNGWLAGTCAIALGLPLFTGCSSSGLVAGVDTADGGDASASGGGGATPTTPPPACPGLPAGAELIPGLVTGQSATSGGAAILRFSNGAYACGSWLTDTTSEGCQSPWAFTLTLPLSAIRPGTYDLFAVSAQFGELYGVAAPPTNGAAGQCSYGSYGIGSVGVAKQGSTDQLVAGGTLEIYTSDPGCITGRITGLTDTMTSAPDHDGAFFALACNQ
jgi:hypothetical protein